jgi:hypothetical protein
MNLNIILIILGIIILIFIIFFVIKSKKSKKSKNNKITINVGYKRNSSNFMMNTSLQQIYQKYSIISITDDITANKIIYMPSAYDLINYEISLMEKTKNNYYFIIHEIDQIVGKDYLWANLYKSLGNKARELAPQSYIPTDKTSLDRLTKDYVDGKIYIAKKNIQRQEGIEIINDKDKIFELMTNSEVAIIQELLQDPMTISGHKINLRVYILIVIFEKNCSVYVYNDGFMYYTPKKFVPNSVDKDVNITTGYIDRKIYEENPLTHKDFREYLGSDSKCVHNNILKLIKNILKCYTKIFIDHQAFYGSVQYQIMGADVAINDKGEAKIMEINKGPDLGGKDKRDSELKCNLVEHMLEIVGILPKSESNEFIKVL